MSVVERFWFYVAGGQPGEPNQCWEWTGCHLNGYGIFSNNGIRCYTHRFSYELFHPLTKSINDIDLCICHSCDNPCCVNPYHLRLDTRQNNNKERMEKDRGNRPIGERNPRCILNETQVLEIRAKYKAGNITQVELGREYNVKREVICDIVNRRSWKHI